MQHILVGFYFNAFLFVYNYIKLLSHKLPRCNSSKILLAAYIVFSPIILCIIKLNIPYIHIPIIIISMVILFKNIYHDNFLITLNYVLFSLGLTYAFSLVGIFITALVIYPIFNKILDELLILEIIASIIQMVTNISIFRLKRLENGLSFLKKDKNTTLGTIISVAIIILTMLMSNINSDLIYIVPVVSIFIIVILFYLWNKFKFQQYYNTINAKREYNFLKHEMSILIKQNETLSKLIHKDNKIIPALEMSVRTYMNSNGDKATGENLLLQLQNLAAERKEIVYKSSPTDIYNTGLIATDSLLYYFKAKAAESNIDFTCILSGNLTESVGNSVTESDFNSILADLIENALIATECNNGHHIHVVIIADKPIIEVYDSGTPFDINVLANLGLKRITTHKGTGTGIGLTSIYEFTEKYDATLTIDETLQTDPRFTKKISICFNSSKAYKIITSREKNDIKILYRREDIIIEQPT